MIFNIWFIDGGRCLCKSSIDQVNRIFQNIKQRHREDNCEEGDRRLGGQTEGDGTCDKKKVTLKEKGSMRLGI